MAQQGLDKTLRCQFGEVPTKLLACEGWDCAALFPSATLHVEGTWLAGNPALAPVLLIAHLLSGGPCFFLRCPTQPAPHPWAELHALLLEQNRAAVLRTGGGSTRDRGSAEVMLVALTGRDGGGSGSQEPIFAGFVASLLGGDFVRQLLIDSRLPLVFDLDETLLVAKSQSQLTKELRSLRDVRRPALQRATGDPQHAAKLRALDREEQLMRDDLKLLQEFAEDDAVTYNGQRLAASIEVAAGNDMQPIERPVIRLPDGDTLLTRIEPENPHSSMVFKLRPNWRAIWGYLGGLMDPATDQPIVFRPPSPKLRFEAFVCTAAERGYALEAWRVLDPDGWMIPLDQRRKRVQSGSKAKALAAVLQLGPGKLPGAHGRPTSHMPLAVIVDDRVEIWDPSNQGQVLQVEPFRPWEEQAALECGLTDTPTTQTLSAQMVRLKDELFNLRMHVFHRAREVLSRQVNQLREQPIDLSQPHQHYRSVMADAPWVAGLLASGRHRVPQPDPLPPALQAATERPVDPRLLRRQQAQQAQQAQQPGAQPDVLAKLSCADGAALLASLTAITGVQVPSAQQPMDQQQQQQQAPPVAAPADPRRQRAQQRRPEPEPHFQPGMPHPGVPPHQQQAPGYGAPPEALGTGQQAQQAQHRPQRQRPGLMPGGSAQQGQQAQQGPAPGVALLQQRMAGGPPADPRQRPTRAQPAGSAPAASGTLFEALDMMAGPGQAAQQQQPAPEGPPGRQLRQPGGQRRLVGLHGPPQGQGKGASPPQLAQQALPPQQQGPTQQQSAWGTAVAGGTRAGPVLPGMHAPPPAVAGPPLQQEGPGGDDPMMQRWRDALGGQQAQQGYGGPHVGAKRKAEEEGGGRAKHSRLEPARQPLAAHAATANGQPSLARLLEATAARQLRLQWQCMPRPDGSWQAAAYVGSWPTQYPPPGIQPAGVAAAPSQNAAMEAAAAAAMTQLAPAAGMGDAGRGRGGRGPAHGPGGGRGRGGVPQPPGRPGAGPRAPGPAYQPQQERDGAGGASIHARNALDTLIGHFPAATNRIEWHEQQAGPDGTSRCRLVINGGEFSAEGTGPPGPRGEKRARQTAALAVLQQCGYAVSFEAPGAFGGPGAMGGGQPRYGGKSLDSRHARQAVAQQSAVSRDHYLASLNDELG